MPAKKRDRSKPPLQMQFATHQLFIDHLPSGPACRDVAGAMSVQFHFGRADGLGQRVPRIVDIASGCRKLRTPQLFRHLRVGGIHRWPQGMGCSGRWRPHATSKNRFVTPLMHDRSSPPAQATPLRPNCPYIGGLTPCVPTVTRDAAKFPFASLCAMTNTCRPGFRSARVAGAKVTIGARRGTCTVNVPPL